jgi:hypothetical protein
VTRPATLPLLIPAALATWLVARPSAGSTGAAPLSPGARLAQAGPGKTGASRPPARERGVAARRR